MNIFLHGPKSIMNLSKLRFKPNKYLIINSKPKQISIYFYFSTIEKNSSSKNEIINSNEEEIFLKKARRPNNPVQRRFDLNDVAEITKFRLSLANSSVALITYLLVNPSLNPNILIFFLSTQMIAMSSQTSNQDIEKEYDKLMIRTCNRPLPKNRIDPKIAKMIAATLYIASNVCFLNFFPLGAFYMANFIFLSYTLVYTPLKRMSTLNTTIGAISGSLPPYLGWLAAGGDFFNIMPLGICTYMFCWQYSHFYGILWIYQDDYRKAGFKMIEDPKRAVIHLKLAFFMKIITGNIVFAGLSLNPFYFCNIFLLSSLWKNSYLPLKEFEKEPTVKNAKNLKRKSYNHLMIFFGLIFVDAVWNLLKKQFEKKNIKEHENKEILN